jgi:chromosome segregation ATPase
MSESHRKLLSEVESGSDLAAALVRLNKALDSLDNAVDASQEARLKMGSMGEEVQRMADDRAKLAQELDKTENRAKRLSETNKEVSRRLVAAMETVRSVIDQPA